MFIDTHSHLNFKAFKKDIDAVIKNAADSGVGKIVIPGAKINSSARAVEISHQYSQCYAAVGIHPHHVSEFEILGKETVASRLAKLTKDKKTVAIGEIGIDYYHYKNYPPLSEENKKSQTELFLLQLNIAMESKLPVIIHCRQAHDDLFSILDNYMEKGKHNLRGVFHCFGGDKKHLEKALSYNYFYIGFDGNITYEENRILQQLVGLTPLDRLFLETDAPFLTPIPLRGKRNEPAYITYTADFVAKIHHKDTAEIARISSENALRLFKF
ncbi:TatD family hydrolase [Patescibacteria group bacterium]|nr:TatD family hydrolase [Patescibacteria group bacterium]